MFTTLGTLIECIYTIEVSADMDGTFMCCGDSPLVQAPVFIIADNISIPNTLTPPNNWNPTQLDHTYIEYGQHYELPKTG
jgi:hypothetical protein